MWPSSFKDMVSGIRVAVIVLNYRQPALTQTCLASLLRLNELTPHSPLRIVVVNNAAADDPQDASGKQLAAWQQAHSSIQAGYTLELLHTGSNLGYSGGNNVGIRHVLQSSFSEKPDYIWLLNNDTEVFPDTLTALLQTAERTPKQTLVSSVLLTTVSTSLCSQTKPLPGSDSSAAQGAQMRSSLKVNDEIEHRSNKVDVVYGNSLAWLYVGGQVHWWQGKTHGHSQADWLAGKPLDYLSGASLLVPVKVFEQAGLLDEAFFLYAEDIEFCLRASRHGFKLAVAEASRVVHHKGATSGGTLKPVNQYYAHRNRLRVFDLHATRLQQYWAMGLMGLKLGESLVKRFLSPKASRRRHYKTQSQVYGHALADFCQGRFGPCPHVFVTEGL